MAQATAAPASGMATSRHRTPHRTAHCGMRRRPGYGLVLAGLVAVAFLALVWNGLTATPSGASQEPPAAAATITVVVGEGDTVWDLAREHAPAGMAVHDYAAAVVAANDLDARRLLPGNVLQLPPS